MPAQFIEETKQSRTPRTPVVHRICLWQKHFKGVSTGDLSCFFGDPNQFYQVGDSVILEEYDPDKNQYTGLTFTATISYISVWLIPRMSGRKPGKVVVVSFKF